MAKKKVNPQLLSPEQYIRQRARLLPIYKCYKGTNNIEDREMMILVVRRHAGGTFTVGGYMLDRWCVGVKDTLWYFNIDQSDLERLIHIVGDRLDNWDEVDYVEAHNWVYGALDWATNAGLSPCKDFALTRYILEEDDDAVELREYPFGRDGEYCLMVKDKQELNKYLPTVKATLGEGNFQTIISPLFSDDDNKEADSSDREQPLKDILYTYSGGDYPQTIQLHYPELEPLLYKNTLHYTRKDIDKVLSFPADALREDLHQLILRELGRQFGKTAEQLHKGKKTDYNIIGNCLLFLGEVGTFQDTLPVLLEVLRQNDVILNYNFGDVEVYFVKPLVYKFLHEDPTCFKPFLLEEGLCDFAKYTVLNYIGEIVCATPALREPVLGMMHEVLEAYLQDLPKCTICDGGVVAFAVYIPAALGATEFLPIVEEIYATGLVDKQAIGNIYTVRKIFSKPIPSDHWVLPYGDIHAIVETFQKDWKHHQ